jgi:hypothetical protein
MMKRILFGYMKRLADGFRLDQQEGQKTRLFVMCEAAGMVPQLSGIVREYGITVLSGGGFNSVTANHAFAEDLTQYGWQAIEVLHIGDHDPSGAHLFLALVEDVTAFADHYGVEITFTRLWP